MPSINLSKFNQITKKYEKLNETYETLNNKLEIKDYEDSVVQESIICEERDVLIEIAGIQGKIAGMLEFLDLRMPEKEQKYKSMLKTYAIGITEEDSKT
jgi:hypothetical protein